MSSDVCAAAWGDGVAEVPDGRHGLEPLSVLVGGLERGGKRKGVAR